MVIETVKFGPVKAEEVCFNSTAIYRLESVLDSGNAAVLIHRLATLTATTRDLIHILWAGLEGGRAYRKLLRQPFTIEEVLALLDEAGGPEIFFDDQGPNLPLLAKCFKAAFPVTERIINERKSAREAAEAARRTLENEPRPTSTTGDSTGPSSSSTPAATASKRKTSGGSRSVN